MKHTQGPWYYSYEGIQGSFEFYREARGIVDGLEYGPFPTFQIAKQGLIEKIKSDLEEVKMTLFEARKAKPPEMVCVVEKWDRVKNTHEIVSVTAIGKKRGRR